MLEELRNTSYPPPPPPPQQKNIQLLRSTICILALYTEGIWPVDVLPSSIEQVDHDGCYLWRRWACPTDIWRNSACRIWYQLIT